MCSSCVGVVGVGKAVRIVDGLIDIAVVDVAVDVSVVVAVVVDVPVDVAVAVAVVVIADFVGVLERRRIVVIIFGIVFVFVLYLVCLIYDQVLALFDRLHRMLNLSLFGSTCGVEEDNAFEAKFDLLGALRARDDVESSSDVDEVAFIEGKVVGTHRIPSFGQAGVEVFLVFEEPSALGRAYELVLEMCDLRRDGGVHAVALFWPLNEDPPLEMDLARLGIEHGRELAFVGLVGDDAAHVVDARDGRIPGRLAVLVVAAVQLEKLDCTGAPTRDRVVLPAAHVPEVVVA